MWTDELMQLKSDMQIIPRNRMHSLDADARSVQTVLNMQCFRPAFSDPAFSL